MTDAVELRALPPEEALDFFDAKGFAPRAQRFDWRDVWNGENARMFTVAKAMDDDVLRALRSAVREALAEGLTLTQFQERVEPTLRSFGWWGRSVVTDPQTGRPRAAQLGSSRRLRTIFDTNLRTAYAAGRWERIQRVKDDLPYLEYNQLDRPTKREAHRPWDGVVLPVDHPFWRTHYPPNGWRCGCYVRQLSPARMRREGLRVTDPAPQIRFLTLPDNRRGSVTTPEGVDPGFGNNPGLDRHDPARQRS